MLFLFSAIPLEQERRLPCSGFFVLGARLASSEKKENRSVFGHNISKSRRRQTGAMLREKRAGEGRVVPVHHPHKHPQPNHWL